MLERLTPEQEALLPVFREKWIKIGLSTQEGEFDEAKIRPLVDAVYAAAKEPPPPKILFVKSPYEGALKYKEITGNNIENVCFGTHDAHWLAFYNYFYEIGIETEADLRPLIALSQEVGWFWPFDELIIISEKPKEIHMVNSLLHREGGPAVSYSDGFAIYSLNGITVPQEVAETPADQLDPHLILTEKNAEVRREIGKKIGYTRILEELGSEVVDETTDANGNPLQLILLDLGDGRRRPFLKMVCPYDNQVRIEGVHPDCTTAEGADQWARPQKLKDLLAKNYGEKYIKPTILT